MQRRFVTLFAAVSAAGAAAVVLAGAAVRHGGTALTALAAMIAVIAVLGLIVLGRLVILAERVRRHR